MGNHQTTDPKNRAVRFPREVVNLPVMSQDNLLDDGETQSGAPVVGSEIRFEDIATDRLRNTWTIVVDFQSGRVTGAAMDFDADQPARMKGLNGIDEEVEEYLSKELFIGVDDKGGTGEPPVDRLFLKVRCKRAHDVSTNGLQINGDDAGLSRFGICDEIVELVGDPIDLLGDLLAAVPEFRGGVGGFGDHLRHPANEVEGVPGLMGQTGCGQIHFLQIMIEFLGSYQAVFQSRTFEETLIGEGTPPEGQEGEGGDNPSKVSVASKGALEGASREHQRKAM